MTQTLANRMTTDSNAVFASCATLPIHQTTLNAQEMAGIDGLWDWEEFASEVVEGAIVGCVVGAVTGGIIGGIPGAVVGATLGTVGGAVAGACSYAQGELLADD